MDEADRSASDDPRIGEVLDKRYRLLSQLGEGGMGIVYEAQHVFLKSRVALKVLRADMADAESIARLKREAQSASAIGNPHIVDVRDFGRLPDGSTYVVMELIEGVDLLVEIRKERMPWKRALHIAGQVAEALGAAHEEGIIHRDLKPENILLTEMNGDPDFVKIVDFGIARIQGAEKLTAAGRIVGTPEYMSPEQCAGVEVDQRADVYALGILLYEMITQMLPFHDEELMGLLRKQLKQRPQPPREAVPEAEIPAALEAIVLRCLAKRPSQRYQTMEAVGEALRTLDADGAPPEEAPEKASRRRDSTAPFPMVEPVEEVREAEAQAPGGSESSPRRGVWTSLAVAAALAAGVATVLLTLSPETDETSPSASADQPASPREEPAARGATEPAEEPNPPATEAVTTLVRIQTTPSGAQVFDGETPLGETPLPMRRPETGERRVVRLHHRGYRDMEIALSSNSAELLHVTLERRPARSSTAPVDVETPDPAGTRPTGPQGPRGHRTGFIDPWNR